MAMEAAIQLMNKEIMNKTEENFKQMRRFDINKDQATKFTQHEKQMDFFRASLSTIQTDHIGDMLVD